MATSCSLISGWNANSRKMPAIILCDEIEELLAAKQRSSSLKRRQSDNYNSTRKSKYVSFTQVEIYINPFITSLDSDYLHKN